MGEKKYVLDDFFLKKRNVPQIFLIKYFDTYHLQLLLCLIINNSFHF